VGNIWDLPLQNEIRAQALDESVCPLLSYVETYAGARFPEGARELYPSFFAAVRRVLRVLVERACASGVAAGDEDARAVLAAEWPREMVEGHHHGALYRDAGERMVVSFARAFRPMVAAGMVGLDPELVLASQVGDGLDVRLDLVGHYRRVDGSVVAIAFRPESLAGDRGDGGDGGDGRGKGNEGSLNWSELAESKRTSLALLEHLRPGVAAYVYSGADGRIYEYKWSKSKKSLPTLAAGLEGRRSALARGEFGSELGKYQCDRCRVRASCPGWIGADRK
jgi:hypothetical protein